MSLNICCVRFCYLVRFAGSALEKCFHKGGMKNFHGVNHGGQKSQKEKKEEKFGKIFSFSKATSFGRFSWIANRTQHIYESTN